MTARRVFTREGTRGKRPVATQATRPRVYLTAVTLEQLEQISQAIALRIVELSGVDISSVALDQFRHLHRYR